MQLACKLRLKREGDLRQIMKASRYCMLGVMITLGIKDLFKGFYGPGGCEEDSTVRNGGEVPNVGKEVGETF